MISTSHPSSVTATAVAKTRFVTKVHCSPLPRQGGGAAGPAKGGLWRAQPSTPPQRLLRKKPRSETLSNARVRKRVRHCRTPFACNFVIDSRSWPEYNGDPIYNGEGARPPPRCRPKRQLRYTSVVLLLVKCKWFTTPHRWPPARAVPWSRPMKPRRWYSSPEPDPNPTAKARPFPEAVYWAYTTLTRHEQGAIIKCDSLSARVNDRGREAVVRLTTPRPRRANTA
jgi:hypothetical protein